MMYLVLGIIALLYLCCFSTWEHMTNSDTQKKLDHHKTATSWDSVHKKKPKLEETAIKGPQITKKEAENQSKQPEPEPEPGPSTKGPNYPDIYGPDILLAPGYKDSGVPGSHDSHYPEPYDFIPAAEFPKGPVAPSPFLTDFSKIMK